VGKTGEYKKSKKVPKILFLTEKPKIQILKKKVKNRFLNLKNAKNLIFEKRLTLRQTGQESERSTEI
jgi:hypothetical protein